jgi:hypothetical protein
MSTSREDYYYGGMQQPKSRRSPQLFQTGQGGRTVLPPLASVIPTLPSPGLLFDVASCPNVAQYDRSLCTVSAYQTQNVYTQPRATQPRSDFIAPSHEAWNAHEGEEQSSSFSF